MNLRRGLLWLVVPALAVAQFPSHQSPDAMLRTGVWGGRTIRYVVSNGQALTGDIQLGLVDSLGGLRGASTTTKLWTGGIIPYVFDTAFTNRERVLTAIGQWQDTTGLQFVARTNQANYIKLVSPATGCNSYIGMQGGEQIVNLAAGCYDGSALHELGHAIGLFHEHSRLDRSQWVQIVHDNLIATCPFEFDFGLAGDSKDVGVYDYGSIMHYDGWADTRNGYPTILTIPPYIPIGEAVIKNTGLSPTDIETVRRLYGKPALGTTIATFPVGLPIVVDGVNYTAPHTFSWGAGSTHAIGVADTVPVDATTRYQFARWSDNGAGQHTVTVSSDVPVYNANFVRYFRVTASANPAGTGTVTLDPPSADGFYPQGSYVRIAATGAQGRSFYQWTGLESFPLSIPEEAGDIFNVNPRSFNVSRPRTILAETLAGENLITLATDPPNLSIEVDGQASGTPARTFWTPGSRHHLAVKDLTQPSRGGLIEFSSQYVFAGWVGGNGTDPAIDVTGPDFSSGPITYTAKFTKQYKADISVIGQGTVDMSPKPISGYYDENTVVRLTPQPASGNRFFDWYGMPANLEAPFSSDVPTNNVCASPLVYKMDRPILASAQMTPALSGGAKPAITANAISSAASGAVGSVSPGEILVLYGQKLGPKDLVPADFSPAGRLDNCLARTLVYFDGVPVPLIYNSAGQVSAIAPYSLAGKSSTQIVLEYQDSRSDAITVPVVAARPAFFTANSSGTGPGAFLDLQYRLITTQNPVQAGSYAQLYATGGGQTTPGGVDGVLALDYQQLPQVALPVRVFLDTVEAEVVYAGTAPGAVAGLLQVNIKIPDKAPTGAAVPITLQVGTFRSPAGVTIAVR
jgi:uncharacterized protein (TIGR03437 family)